MRKIKIGVLDRLKFFLYFYLFFFIYTSEFENLAIGVLNIFDLNSDDLINSIVLLRQINIYGMDCLQMAVEARCLKFVSLPTVQILITEIWNGNLTMSKGFKANLKFIISCLSFGFLAPFLVFDRRDKLSSFVRKNLFICYYLFF